MVQPWQTRAERFVNAWPRPEISTPSPAAAGRLQAYLDAHTDGPGIWKWQHYAAIYERHCKKFVGRPIELLEIGIYSGGSLGLWRDYFGPQCHITGVDIEPAVTIYEGPGIHVLVGDQADPAFWRRTLPTLPRFDLVIDDGGHEAHQQATTLEAVLPHMNPGGVYVCEDIHGVAHRLNRYLSRLLSELNAFEMEPRPGHDIHVRPSPFQATVDGIHLYAFAAVIELRSDPLTELTCPRRGTEWQPFYEGE